MVQLIHCPLFEHIRKYFEGVDSDQQTLFIFAPYIKTTVLSKLLEGLNNRVVVVTTWEPRDIQLGSSELALYPFCKDHNVSLYVGQNMHLKIYSVGMSNAILATGNVSARGLLPSGNYEAGVMIELTSKDRLFFENIRGKARLVDETMYEELWEWSEKNRQNLPKSISLNDVVSAPRRNDFLISALPMTRNVDMLVNGYVRITSGMNPSDDPETSACIFHDLANYGIGLELSKEEFLNELTRKFFSQPFIQKIDEFIAPEAYFGRIKEWVQDNCTDVPVPSRREITGNVQVLLEWFTKLGNGKYAIDVPGRHSQRIRKI